MESGGKDVASTVGRPLMDSQIQAFKAGLRGTLLRPGDDGYDSSRKIFNALIDKHPALIVKCTGVSDVIRAVNFARENRLLLAVRGGGHNVAGNALCDGGLVIDLSNMKSVRVDPVRRTARAEAGVNLTEFHHETQVHGLATTMGMFSPTGIAGLTLGGGLGWLAGKYGLACDNLLSADVVTADGKLITASSMENQDLFWGLRGGGGNFGVVTSFKFRLHPVGDVLGGIMAWPLARAEEVFKFFREFTRDVPDELGIFLGTGVLPEGPVVISAVCYAGPLAEGEKVLEPLRKFGPPILYAVKKMRYEEVQTMLDPSLPWGLCNYWKSGYFSTLSDGMIETMISYSKNSPSPLSVILIEVLSGEATRISPTTTAFNIRSKLYNFMILAIWQNPNESEKNLDWVRRYWSSMQPFLSSKVYVNYLSQEGDERVRAAYGENYARLAALKKKYDPTNLFRVNQNIKPAA